MMKRLAFQRGAMVVLALAVLAALALALWLGGFGQERAAAAPGPDLVITKEAEPAEDTPVASGGTITYTLTASNTGDTGAHDVIIRDYIGDGLGFVSAEGPWVNCYDKQPPQINCVADIDAQESITVTIVLRVTASPGSYVYNGAYVDPENAKTEDNEAADDPALDCGPAGGDVGEGSETWGCIWFGGSWCTEPDNYDCARHEVGAPDLTITKTASPAEGTAVATGSTITYSLTAENAYGATATATDIAIRDYMGSGLDLVSVTEHAGVDCYDIAPPEINCKVDSLAPGDSAKVDIEASVTASSGTVLNGAYIDPDDVIDETNEDANDDELGCSAVGEGSDAGGETEPDNYDCTAHTVGALPDLVITKTASPAEGTVASGSTITYTLKASNTGTADAHNVAIRDWIGTGLDLKKVTEGTGVSCTDKTPPQINCTADIAAGGNVTVTIEVTVTASSGTVLNGAYVDPDKAISESNDDADDKDLECGTVGEGSDAGSPTEDDNYDCTRHTVGAATATPTPTPTPGGFVACPLPGKWVIAAWLGPSGTAIGEALATCTGVTIEAAYSLDPTANTWQGYFRVNPEISSLQTLNNLQSIMMVAR